MHRDIEYLLHEAIRSTRKGKYDARAWNNLHIVLMASIFVEILSS